MEIKISKVPHQYRNKYLKNKTAVFSTGSSIGGGSSSGGTSSTIIEDSLTSTSTSSALSANQGSVLKGLVDSKAAKAHTHTYSDVQGLQGDINYILQDLSHKAYEDHKHYFSDILDPPTSLAKIPVIPSLKLTTFTSSYKDGEMYFDYNQGLYDGIKDLNPTVVVMRKRRVTHSGRENYEGNKRKQKTKKWGELGNYRDYNGNNYQLYTGYDQINCKLQNSGEWQYLRSSQPFTAKNFTLSRMIYNPELKKLHFSKSNGRLSRNLDANKTFKMTNWGWGVAVRIDNPSFDPSKEASTGEMRYKGVPRYLYGEITEFGLILEYDYKSSTNLQANLVCAKFTLK